MRTWIRRQGLVLCALGAVAAGIPAAALAWSGGGHTYIALHTHKKAGLTTPSDLCNRVYGALSVDLFNYDFSATGQALAAIVHGEGNATAAEAWEVATGVAAPTRAELAFAYGFSSHNDGWGTDYVAHWSSRTLDPSQGYVVWKAAQLAAVLPSEALVLIPAPLVPLVTHVLVEYSMDLLLADADPAIGPSLVEAASLAAAPGYACAEQAGSRVLVDTLFPHVAGIVGDGAAEATILGSDLVNRQVMFLLGSALAQPTPEARRDAMAALVAVLAGAFMPIPPELPPEQLVALIAQLLDAGKAICAADLMYEVQATIGRVNGTMSALGIAP
jgi:hypothetical protein